MSSLLKTWLVFLILGSLLIVLHSKLDTTLDYQKFSTSKEKILQPKLVDFIKKEKLNKSNSDLPKESLEKTKPTFQYLP